MNEATGPNSSSEESDAKGRNKPHQKIILPIFEKKTIQEATFWWRRLIKYVKMTRYRPEHYENRQRNYT